jgi:hypothetical protein
VVFASSAGVLILPLFDAGGGSMTFFAGSREEALINRLRVYYSFHGQ